MSTHNQALRYAATAGDDTGTDRRKALETLARLGYLSKGIVYAVLGSLSVWAALQSGREVQGARGALETLLRQPFGQVILGAVAVGLAFYVIWRLVQTAVDPEVSAGETSWVERAYYAVSALAYAALTVYAARLLFSGSSSGSGSDYFFSFLPAQWLPFVFAAVGVVLLIAAARGARHAVRAQFCDRLRLGELTAKARRVVLWIGRTGLLARAVVFALLGVALLAAATSGGGRPDELGTAGALERMQNLGGPWALAALAAGQFAYGAYQMVKAKYRRIVLE